MLVFMFYAARSATGGRVPAEFLPYLYISNACFGLVGMVMFGLSYAVVRDREHYRMLKYIYISPGDFQTYFLGRGAARGLEGTVGGVLNIGVGLLPLLRTEAVRRHRRDVAHRLPRDRRRNALGVRDDPRGRVPEPVAKRHVPV